MKNFLNKKSILFIICVNNNTFMSECRYYINQLNVPEGFTIEVHEIHNASNITSAYQSAMLASNAKYKIYMHQDLFVINKNMLFEMLKIFMDPQIGLIGTLGGTLYEDANIHSFWNQGSTLNATYLGVNEYIFPAESNYSITEGIDGMFMATQYDIDWNTQLSGWHFYDVSQSINFQKAGYKVCVSNHQPAWTMHVSEYCNIEKYEQSRKQLCQLYPDYFKLVPADIHVNDIGTTESLKEALYHEIIDTEISNYGNSTLLNLTQDEFFNFYYKIKFLIFRIEHLQSQQALNELCSYIKNKIISAAFLTIAIKYCSLNPDYIVDLLISALN